MTLVLISSGMFLNGSLSAAHYSSPTDLAPSLAGTVFGLSNTLSSGVTGYVTAVTVGAVTQENYTFQVDIASTLRGQRLQIFGYLYHNPPLVGRVPWAGSIWRKDKWIPCTKWSY